MELPLLLLTPFPMIADDGTLTNGLLLPQATACQTRCVDKKCRHFEPPVLDGQIRLFTCPLGFSVAVSQVAEVVVRVNGVIETASNLSPPEFKKLQKDRKLKLPELEQWIVQLAAAIPRYRTEVEEKAKNSVAALHDIKSLIGSLLKTAEEAVWEAPGQSLEDKYENAPEKIRTIANTCSILVSLLQFTDIVSNPALAGTGQPKPTPIYRLLHHLRKNFESLARYRNIRLSQQGSSFAQPRLYASFLVVCLVLLDNAIKHSDSNSEVVITVDDRVMGTVFVSFDSSGVIVPEDDRRRIFEKSYRSSNARDKGSGLGLYIADVIAAANGFKIAYSAIVTSAIHRRGVTDFTLLFPRMRR